MHEPVAAHREGDALLAGRQVRAPESVAVCWDLATTRADARRALPLPVGSRGERPGDVLSMLLFEGHYAGPVRLGQRWENDAIERLAKR